LPAFPLAVVRLLKLALGLAGAVERGGAGVDVWPGGTGEIVSAGVGLAAAAATWGQVMAWTPDSSTTATTDNTDKGRRNNTRALGRTEPR
jgi:hypothetical protein